MVAFRLAFDMLASLVGTMDRLAVETYHPKIYEHCLAALDLRRQHPDFLKNNINMVERSIIYAIITLTMKLTEGTLVGHFFFVLWNGPSPKLISPHQRKVWTVQLFSTNWFTNLLNNTGPFITALNTVS